MLCQDDPALGGVEPEIYATTRRFGTVLENVVIDPVTRELNLDDPTLAGEGGAYPIDFIPELVGREYGAGAEERRMLTADAFGVLPPIAKLTPEQAMYHFLSATPPRLRGPRLA